MTEVKCLPPTEKPNQEIQMDFFGPIRFKQRRIFILGSIDRYSRWSAACSCETLAGKTAKRVLEQNINFNGVPQTIRTEKGTTFTGKEFKDFCENINIKLIHGTPYIHTPTGLVERGIKTLKDYMRASVWDGCTINEALSRSLNVMRPTVHPSYKETPSNDTTREHLETEVTNYLNLSPIAKTIVISAKPETLQVYTFSNSEGHHDQLVMKAPQKLKENVSIKFPYLFLGKKVNKNKFESAYDTKPQIA